MEIYGMIGFEMNKSLKNRSGPYWWKDERELLKTFTVCSCVEGSDYCTSEEKNVDSTWGNKKR